MEITNINEHESAVNNNDNINESASYDTGHKLNDFQDLPSLPMDNNNDTESRDKISKLLYHGDINNDKINRLAVPSQSMSTTNNLRGSHRAFLQNSENIKRQQILDPMQDPSIERSVEQSIELQLNLNGDSRRIQDVLQRNGFDKRFTKRAFLPFMV